MSCNNPIKCYRTVKADETTGKRPVVFRPPVGEPYTLMSVPCTKCNGCQKDRTIEWGIRCHHEAQQHESNQFLSLSYDKKNLPKDKMLDRRHLQLFFKRLRKNTGQKIKFMYCGEYGERTWRAHYHAIIFGLEIDDLTYCKTGKNGDPLYTSKKIDATWGLGMVICGHVSFASSQYVAKYINKRSHILKRLREASNFVAPFGQSSQGLGIDWLKKYYKDVYPNDYITIDGNKYKVPKGYDKWMEQNHPEELKEVKRNRYKKMMEYQKEKGGFLADQEAWAREEQSTYGGTPRDSI